MDRVRLALDAIISEQRLREVHELIGRVCVPLADFIARRVAQLQRCVVVGIAGSQGAGKSTVSALVRALLAEGHGLRVLILSLDDFYLSKAQRLELARTVHPLLITRGVPGTHEVSAMLEVFQRAREAGPGAQISLPQFSKATDDRRPELRLESGPFDVVLLEGWCVGARVHDEDTLIDPINALERDEDSDGTFRRFVNQQLAQPYAQLWAELDALVFLAVPSFETVYQFRREQEHKLRLAAGPGVGMSDDALQRFIQHYERITRHMLRDLPSRADVVVRFDAARQVVDAMYPATPKT
jgi:D-glycerate 3-kinase